MATKTPYLRIKIAIGIVGILAMIAGSGIVGYYFYGKGVVKTALVEQQLLVSVQQTNENCPIMLDNDTKLEGVMFHEGPELEYRYTMVNILAQDYDGETVQPVVEKSIIENIKKDETLAFAKANGVTFTYIFNDKNGDFLLKVKVTPDKYK